MTKSMLGRMERVDARAVWKSEPGDFTPWLATESNLQLLGDTINLELELVGQEQSVGVYRADIVCHETASDSRVLIENQLERTDHLHLGQLMTYAAGLDAVTIVWVATRFSEEHRAALDWLNEITRAGVDFFGLEIELWRIGDSQIAPKFNIVCKPNDWTKSGRASSTISSELSETEKLRLNYWEALREYLLEQGSSIKSKSPRPEQWTTFAIGKTGMHLAVALNARDGMIIVYLCIQGTDRLSYFNLLKQQRAEVESVFGSPLLWQEKLDRKESHIKVLLENVDIADGSDWGRQHRWITDQLEGFNVAFRERIRQLDPGDWIGHDTDRDSMTDDARDSISGD